MKKKYVILLAITLAYVVIDQITKYYVHENFYHGEEVSVISDFFSFTYVRNPGAAFGLLATSEKTFREIFFLISPPIALLIILVFLRGVKDDDWIQIYAFSSIFAGAIGNYIDRLRFRYVIDFLDFYLPVGKIDAYFNSQFGWDILNVTPFEKWNYPAFNFADIWIVTGVTIIGLLVVKETLEERRQRKVKGKL